MIVADISKRETLRQRGWWGDKTLADLFQENALANPTRVAVIDAPNRDVFAFGKPRRLSYAELSAEVERMAGALLAAGIRKDDVIVIQLPNISEFVSLYFAAALIGAIISPIAVQYRSHELATIFKIVRPKAFICGTRMHHADHVDVVRPLLNDQIQLMTLGPQAPIGAIDLGEEPERPELLARHKAQTPIDADDVFTICWTSGTTGVPKGVPRSHNHWIGIAPGTYATAGLAHGSIMLNPFPLINMASIGGVTMSWLRVAGTMVLHHPFDAQVYLKQIEAERPSFTIAPPAILNMLLQDEGLLASVDLSSLRVIGSGSAPLAPAMVKGFQERLGIEVLNIFGSNEGVSLVTAPRDVPDPVERASYFPGRLTLTPYFGSEKQPNMEWRLVPTDGGDPITAMNVTGELHIRGPSVFEGYWDAAQDASAFTKDGYFKTGDLFQIEQEGRFLRFMGRCKDLIIRGGVNISPEEIDQLLNGHPQLSEACVFSIPDAVLGERIGVAIVPRAGEHVGLEQVTTFLKELGLAIFKLPERLFVFESLPRNATNKVMRNEVRERALASLGLE